MVPVPGPHMETHRPRKCFSVLVCAPHISGGLCPNTHPGHQPKARIRTPRPSLGLGHQMHCGLLAPGGGDVMFHFRTGGAFRTFGGAQTGKGCLEKQEVFGASGAQAWFGLSARGCARRDPDEWMGVSKGFPPSPDICELGAWGLEFGWDLGSEASLPCPRMPHGSVV